ncbi:hypothetical protein VPH35_088088 [Triticum aestivum]
MADERSRRGGAEAGPYASDARVRPQSTRTQRPSMAARVDVGGRGEELARPGTGNGAEAAGSGDSGGAGDERLHGRRPAGFKRRLKVCQIYFHFMHGLIPPLDTVKRENFHLEGPTGVMKRLEALWKIMKLTDTELINC